LIKIIIKEENLKWHLEAFASELFNYRIKQNKREIKRENVILILFSYSTSFYKV